MIARVGIDPGLTGCVCVLPPIDGEPRFFDAPVIETVVSGKKRHVPDEGAMVHILEGALASIQYAATSVHVTIEKVNAMPSFGPGGRRTMGATSMFNFGYGYGLWCGILAALRIPHDRVHPATWKARLLGGTSKDDGAAAQAGSRLYPVADHLLRGPKGGLKMGRVDALLIAHYGKITADSAG